MELFTCSFSAYSDRLGLPVVTSLTVPREMPEAKTWPKLWTAMPRWAYFRKPSFAEEYAAQLERFGPAKIARGLHQIATEYDAERLVLLCHERDWDRCHRQQFASWLMEQTGELVRELGAVGVVVPRHGCPPLPYVVNPCLCAQAVG